MPRILYIGDFREFFSTENYITHGFKELGCEVLRVQEEDVPSAKSVLGFAISNKIDFVLFSKGHFPGSDEVCDLLRENGIVTVGWIFDLFFDVPAYFGRRKLTNGSFRADLCCMTDGGHTLEWRTNGVNHRTLRQGIHEPDAFYGEEVPEVPEIIFTGTYSYEARVEMIEFLKKTYGDKFMHYGRGGMKRPVRGVDLNNILATAKIVVGDSMPSDNYWSNRIYEITGRGGFMIHPIVKGLEKEFEDGVHFVGYKFGNLKELKDKIDYYLTHDAEREKIRKAGHEYTKKNYTYTKRCEQLINYVNEFKRSKK